MADVTLPLPAARILLHVYYRSILQRRIPWRLQRTLLDLGAAIQPLPAGSGGRRHRLVLGGRYAERVGPASAAPDVAILYLHGGGYTVGSIASHRALAAHLAFRAGCPVYLLDYRLAPENPFPAALDDAVSAFEALTGEHGYSPAAVALAGDSAGGGLALAAARRLVDRGARPAALGLIAPWTDPAELAPRRRDAVINRDWGSACAAAYLGGAEPDDPGYAPLRGNVADLPPTLVEVGARELLYDQCVALVGAVRAAGGRAELRVHPRLWHVAQAQAGLVREAAEELAYLAEFLRDALQPARLRSK